VFCEAFLSKTSTLAHTQWRKQLLKMFGPELIRINSLIKSARSAISKIRVFFAALAAKFWKGDISSASERAFPGVLGDVFGCSTPSKKRCFSIQEFTRFLSIMSSQRRATRSDVSFQTKYLSAWSRQNYRLQVRHSTCCTLFLINCFGNGVVRFVSQEVWFDTGFVI